MKIGPITYSSESLAKIDEMLQSNDFEACKLALSLALQEFPKNILNYYSDWLYDNFKFGLVKAVIEEGINCKEEYKLYKYCYAIHFILTSFQTVLTEIV